MTPIVKLVFGIGYDKPGSHEYAAVLSHARRQDMPPGALTELSTIIQAASRRSSKPSAPLRPPAAKPDREIVARAALASAPVLATVSLAGVETDFVSLIGRREADGSVAILSISAVDDGGLVRATKALHR